MVFDWSKYLATGIQLPAGTPSPQRKEIRTLQPEELWLFQQGLAKFQAVPMTDPLSYYQIAGIHGLPFQTWPNDPQNKGIPANNSGGFGGFCTHTSIIFLTWHRPYLALFEATLCGHVNDVAKGIDSSFEDKAKYLDAAKNFRLPYWDWASNSAIFPEAALKNVAPAKQPNFNVPGFTAPTYNPLYQCPFQSGATSDITLTDRSGRKNAATVRYPNAGSAAATQLQEALDGFFKNPGQSLGLANNVKERNLAERAAYILLSYQRYGPMSNNEYRRNNPNPNTSKPEIWGSLEDIHNNVHGLTGGGGQMSNPAYAAFDPIFWLHHANIDRMFAIWEALHQTDNDPTTWVTDQLSDGGGWSTQDTITDPKTGRKVFVETAKSKLYPFRDTKTTWYDSDKTKRTEAFGYTYPETDGLQYPLTADAVAGLTAKITNLYTPPGLIVRQSMMKVESAGQQLLPQAMLLRQVADKKVTANHAQSMTLSRQLPDQQTLLKRSLELSKPVIRDLAPNNKYLEWLVNIKAEKHALGGKYSVSIFLGPVEEEEVILWPLSPHYVGTFNPFGQDADSQCVKCREDQHEHLEIAGQIPLTIALIERYLAGMLPDIGIDTVVPYLTENLHWRLESNGTIIDDRSHLPGLKVFVVSNEVTLPEDHSQLPRYAHDVTIHREITTNRTGEGRGNGTGLARGQN